MSLPILGQPTLKAQHFKDFLRNNHHNVPGELVDLYYAYSYIFGIEPGAAICQSWLETDYWRNDWCLKSHNMCGLGVTGTPGAGSIFSNFQAGILAHLAHLWAYAGSVPDKNDILDVLAWRLDTRFNLARQKAERGNWNVLNYSDLDKRWAVPGVGYGWSVERIYQEVSVYPQQQQ